MGHIGVGLVIQGWIGSYSGGVGHVVRQPKNDRSYLRLNIGAANNFPPLIHIPHIHFC